MDSEDDFAKDSEDDFAKDSEDDFAMGTVVIYGMVMRLEAKRITIRLIEKIKLRILLFFKG